MYEIMQANLWTHYALMSVDGRIRTIRLRLCAPRWPVAVGAATAVAAYKPRGKAQGLRLWDSGLAGCLLLWGLRGGPVRGG